jgi:hypothetical protein
VAEFEEEDPLESFMKHMKEKEKEEREGNGDDVDDDDLEYDLLHARSCAAQLVTITFYVLRFSSSSITTHQLRL